MICYPKLYNVYYKAEYAVVVIHGWNDTLMYCASIELRLRLLWLGVLAWAEDLVWDLPHCVWQPYGAHTWRHGCSFYSILNMACSIYTKLVYTIIPTKCQSSSRGKLFAGRSSAVCWQTRMCYLRGGKQQTASRWKHIMWPHIMRPNAAKRVTYFCVSV